MSARIVSSTNKPAVLPKARWLQIGLQAAVGAILAVLITQAALLAVWPELAGFKPLESYGRSAVFTLIPVIVATAVFAWLVKTQEQPVRKFLWISAFFLLLSFIPDYLLPIPDKTFAASSAAAFLHLVAGIVAVALILNGYARSTLSKGKK
jgi:hypothetical protein